MSLYLCVIDEATYKEYEGVEVGPYSYFGSIRDIIKEKLGAARVLTEFPLFMGHSDCDGEWDVEVLQYLEKELSKLKTEMSKFPPQILSEQGWYINFYRKQRPKNLDGCFIDVDGENLFDRLLELCFVAMNKNLPIMFQ